MNVLSLYDGMSCTQLALKSLGVRPRKYYAAEWDKYASSITQKNFPDTIPLGDVTKWREWDVEWSTIDLIVAGFPCQSWSMAGARLGDRDARGQLFWTTLDIIQHVLEANPKAKFLMENVKMKSDFEKYITHHTEQALGVVNKHLINSALVSAQNRQRYYWSNIEGIEQPKDKGIVLKDILEQEPVHDKYTAGDSLLKNYAGGNQLNPTYKSQANTIHPLDGKTFTLCAGTHGYANGYVAKKPSPQGLILAGHASNIRGHDSVKRVYDPEGKAPTLTTMGGGHREPKVIDVNDMTWRKLTPLECERLQTVPDGYTEGVSNTQRYKMLGNGFTVDVIAHILSYMEQVK